MVSDSCTPFTLLRRLRIAGAGCSQASKKAKTRLASSVSIVSLAWKLVPFLSYLQQQQLDDGARPSRSAPRASPPAAPACTILVCRQKQLHFNDLSPG